MNPDEVHDLLAGLLDDNPLGVSVLDARSHFLYVNDAMAGLHGVARVEHLGRPVHEVLPGIAPAIAQAVAAALVDGAVTTELAVDGPSPNDPSSLGHWRMSVSPWRDADGVVIGASVVARNVTAETRTRALEVRSRERRAARYQQQLGISRALQDAMFTRLPEANHLELRARYLPAAQDVAVGGDWYDAVVSSDGATSVVVGDVSGHDSNAAATMGQLRGVLRAYLWDRDETPAQVVQRVDRALPGLQVELLATLVCGRIEQPESARMNGLRRFRWTNAGHPPPLLLDPDGIVRVLDSEPNLLIGFDPGAPRTDQVVDLLPGSTLLLYTDGLVERRGQNLDEGIERLRDAVAWRAGSSLEELLDDLLDEVGDANEDDDVALLAVRLHDEARTRPAEAGPGDEPDR